MVWDGAYKIRVHDSKCLKITTKFDLFQVTNLMHTSFIL